MVQLTNNKSIQDAFSDLNRLSKQESAKRKLSFQFESEYLNYQPFLKDFSSNKTAVSWCGHFIGDGKTEDEIVDLLEALYNLILNNIEDQYKKSQS